VLDFVTHAPDMPLWPGRSPRLGLGLWNSIPGTLAVDGVLWGLALILYLRGQRARSWVGVISLGSLVGVCTVMWALGPWAPPPPNVRALAWFALGGWMMVPWALWVDRSFQERSPTPRRPSAR
jgi:membrane associated rhomboid family serine protease